MGWLAFALLSALLLSTRTLLEKEELKRVHSFELAVILSLVEVVLLSALLPWVNFTVPGAVWGAIYLISLIAALALWFGSKALRHLDVSLVSPLSSLNVLSAIFFAFLFLGERLTLIHGLGIFILLYALWFLEQRELSLASAFHPSISLGEKSGLKAASGYRALLLLSVIFLGIASVLDKWVLGKIDAISFIYLVHWGLAINFLLLYFLINRRVDYLLAAARELSPLTLWNALASVASRLFYAQALFLAPLVLVTPVRRLSALFTTLLGGVLFKEKGLFFRLLVTLLMLLGTYLLVR